MSDGDETLARAAGQDDAELLVALRHELRRKILRTMFDDEAESMSPRRLSHALHQPLSNVSYHVRVLADCGAVELVDTAPVRGTMQHFYTPTITEPWALAVLGLEPFSGAGLNAPAADGEGPSEEA